ncbi:unnamed protein product [Boreogadus saida]
MTSRWGDVVEGSLSLVLELWRLMPRFHCRVRYGSVCLSPPELTPAPEPCLVPEPYSFLRVPLFLNYQTFQKGPTLYLPSQRGPALQTFQTFQKGPALYLTFLQRGPALYLAFVFADAGHLYLIPNKVKKKWSDMKLSTCEALILGWEIADLSPISRCKIPVDKKPQGRANLHWHRSSLLSVDTASTSTGLEGIPLV